MALIAQRRVTKAACIALLATGATIPCALANEQAVIAGCNARLREIGGPDGAQGGRVVSSEASETGFRLMLEDAGRSIWRCLAAPDGRIEEFAVELAADDGEGAMAGAPVPVTPTVDVRFPPGAIGSAYGAMLRPGDGIRYALGARRGQILTVDVSSEGPEISFQILEPNESYLRTFAASDNPFRKRLRRSGRHIVEVINNGLTAAAYRIDITIE